MTLPVLSVLAAALWLLSQKPCRKRLLAAFRDAGTWLCVSLLDFGPCCYYCWPVARRVFVEYLFGVQFEIRGPNKRVTLVFEKKQDALNPVRTSALAKVSSHPKC